MSDAEVRDRVPRGSLEDLERAERPFMGPDREKGSNSGGSSCSLDTPDQSLTKFISHSPRCVFSALEVYPTNIHTANQAGMVQARYGRCTTTGQRPKTRPSSHRSRVVWTLCLSLCVTHTFIHSQTSDVSLIFLKAGLFSAVVTAFIIESYKTLSQDSDNVTVFYLQQISQELSKLSSGFSSSPVPDPASPPAFTASAHYEALNILFVLSLIGSLSCALGATLVQAWTSNYLRNVNRAPDVVARARDRAWYFDGLEKSQMQAFASGVLATLHISLFIFFAGFSVFLFPINRSVANAAMGTSIAVSIIYLTFAFMDIFVKNSPYTSPISSALSLTLDAAKWAIVGVGFSIFITGAVILGVSLVAFSALALVIAIPAVPFIIYEGGHKEMIQNIKQKIHDFFSVDTPHLPPGMSLETYRKGNQVEHIDSHTMRASPGMPLQDIKALKWLLRRIVTVADLEDFVDGIELFVEKTSDDKRRYARIILELGGENVGPFGAGLGLCVGYLLETCTHTGSDELPLEHRRARVTSAVRAMISVFSHSGSEERTQGITISDTAPLAIWEILQDGDRYLPSTRWIEWVDVFLWEVIISLRDDNDQEIALYVSYLTTLLVHRAFLDIAFRLESGEIEIVAPGHWDLPTLLAALKSGGDERPELYELAVAIMLIPHLQERPSGITSRYELPAAATPEEQRSRQKKNRWRPLKVTLSSEELDQHGVPVPSVPVSSETFRNESTLLALTSLLDQTPIDTSLLQSNLLPRVFRSICQDGSAKGTSVKLQRNLVLSLERHRLESCSNPDVRATGPTVTKYDPSRSAFRFSHVLNGIVEIVDTMQDAQSLSAAQDILVDIFAQQPKAPLPMFRNVRQPLTSVIAEHVEQDDKAAAAAGSADLRVAEV